jgi:3-hydroxyacyl-[acyl-carrier-protein] dehydratase
MDLPMDIENIMEHLPHRYPFILVDRILAMDLGKTITGLKNVTINEPFFQGHFPGKPIMPGVLILEAMAQVGGVLAVASMDDSLKRPLMYFMGIDGVKFRKPVIPGDQLIIDAAITKQRAKIMKFSCSAKVQDQLVAEAQLMATLEVST